jgi:ComF family protein
MRSGSTSPTSQPQTASPPEPPYSISRTIADSLIAVLIAPRCAACDAPLDRPTMGAVCPRCWKAIVPLTPPFCRQCGDPLPSWRVISLDASRCPRCRRRGSAMSSARAVGPYDGALRSILHALKYGRHPSLAKPLAGLMAACAGDLLLDVDLVVPVPLHRRRLRQRGFNQAEELAKHLGLRWKSVLRRTRATPSQTDLPAARRHANVKDAFALRRNCAVEGLTILLVDDVSTTGATLNACAAVLQRAGAGEIRALTAARVVSRLP